MNFRKCLPRVRWALRQQHIVHLLRLGQWMTLDSAGNHIALFSDVSSCLDALWLPIYWLSVLNVAQGPFCSSAGQKYQISLACASHHGRLKGSINVLHMCA